jgi:hypothetical protein
MECHASVRPGATWQHSATIVPAVPGDAPEHAVEPRRQHARRELQNILGVIVIPRRSSAAAILVECICHAVRLLPNRLPALDGEANTMAIEEATIVEADIIGI